MTSLKTPAAQDGSTSSSLVFLCDWTSVKSKNFLTFKEIFVKLIRPMKGHVFNIDNGYLEGLCRGFKNGILRQGDYLNLVQCETLEGKFLGIKVTKFN